MSDNSDADQQTIQKRPRKPRVLTDAHREKLIANVAKARAIRVTKTKERKEGKLTDELIMREIIEEKKKAKIFGVEDEHSDSTPKPQKSKSKKEPVVESSESEQSQQSDTESEDDEAVDSVSSQSVSETSSSDDDAEFVLKRKVTPKKPAQVKKEKKVKSKKEAESILKKMAAMTAEIAALKREKRKQSKVNVYVNQHEKKAMAPQQRMQLLDL